MQQELDVLVDQILDLLRDPGGSEAMQELSWLMIAEKNKRARSLLAMLTRGPEPKQRE